jgi:hypothetical protein
MSQRFKAKQGFQNKYDVTYIVVVVRVRLASQRGGRFDKSTNENA